jgi:NADPH:quinone reductase-like Zn-dependent oxidoreductase
VTIADPEAFRLGVTFSSEAARAAEALAEVARQAAYGRIRLTEAETLPLEEASAAHAVLDTGHGRGKIVLLVD